MAKARPDDYFICQNCGAEVPLRAKSCPECGADDETGWKAGAHQESRSGLLADPDPFDYEAFVKKEMPAAAKSPRRDMLLALAIALAAGIAIWLLRR